MNPSEVLLLTFLIGIIAGLRSVTAPAMVAWAGHRGWLDLTRTSFSFMGSTTAVVIFTLLAIAELIADQLPSTPSRLKPPGLIARIVLGGFSGAVLASAGAHSAAIGALLGVAGSIAGAFAGHAIRTGVVKALHVPDIVIALLEDAVAIGGGLFYRVAILNPRSTHSNQATRGMALRCRGVRNERVQSKRGYTWR